ncbi:MAG: hypothetical protein ABIT38_03335, partial [Gemmatimonadaceae bacterium]
MVWLPLRKLPAVPSVSLHEEWLSRIAEPLKDERCDRSLLCRDTLLELVSAEHVGHWEEAVSDTRLPLGQRVALSALDPRNVTLEPEYYADCDDARFQPVKP